MTYPPTSHFADPPTSVAAHVKRIAGATALELIEATQRDLAELSSSVTRRLDTFQRLRVEDTDTCQEAFVTAERAKKIGQEALALAKALEANAQADINQALGAARNVSARVALVSKDVDRVRADHQALCTQLATNTPPTRLDALERRVRELQEGLDKANVILSYRAGFQKGPRTSEVGEELHCKREQFRTERMHQEMLPQKKYGSRNVYFSHEERQELLRKVRVLGYAGGQNTPSNQLPGQLRKGIERLRLDAQWIVKEKEGVLSGVYLHASIARAVPVGGTLHTLKFYLGALGVQESERYPRALLLVLVKAAQVF